MSEANTDGVGVGTVLLEPRPIQEDLPTHSLRESQAFEDNDPTASIPPPPDEAPEAPPAPETQSWVFRDDWDSFVPQPQPSMSADSSGAASEVASLRAEVAQLSAMVSAIVEKQSTPTRTGEAEGTDDGSPTDDELPTTPTEGLLQAVDAPTLSTDDGGEAEPVEIADFELGSIDPSAGEGDTPSEITTTEPSTETVTVEPTTDDEFLPIPLKEGKDLEDTPNSEVGLPVAIQRDGRMYFPDPVGDISIWKMLDAYPNSADDTWLALKIYTADDGNGNIYADGTPMVIERNAPAPGYMANYVERDGSGKQTAMLLPVAHFKGGTWEVMSEGGIYEFFYFEDQEDGKCFLYTTRLI